MCPLPYVRRSGGRVCSQFGIAFIGWRSCTCESGYDSAVLGTSVVRGQLLALWVLEHGLCIFSRLETSMPMEDSWTCKRVTIFFLKYSWISFLSVLNLYTESLGITIV